jgi:hypothetical protein
VISQEHFSRPTLDDGTLSQNGGERRSPPGFGRGENFIGPVVKATLADEDRET